MDIKRTGSLVGAIAVASILVAACSGSAASGTPVAAAPAAASSEGPSVAPSEAPAASAAAAESAQPVESSAIPSFVLPSTDKGLEALLPNELCGEKATKMSLGGEMFTQGADKSFLTTLQALGKTASDVGFAIAGPGGTGTCQISTGVFQIKGADGGQLQSVFLAEAAKQGAVTQKSLGGKDVYVQVDKGGQSTSYFYFKGDAIFFVVAPDEKQAATTLATMP
jgi:hypothetical protein